MSFQSMTSRAASYVVTAANDWNVMVANFDAIWVGTTGGDMDYYSSSTAKTRIAIGSAFTFLRSNGSVPAWLSLVYRRQGGSATVWSTPGTTTYTPTATIIQAGTQDVTVSSGGTNSVAITYPNAFNQRPVIFLGTNMSGGLSSAWSAGWTDDTTSGFNLHLKFVSTSQTGTYTISWMAVGQ